MLCTKSAARSAMLAEWQSEIRQKAMTPESYRAGGVADAAILSVRRSIADAFLSELDAKALASLAGELEAAAKGFRRLEAAGELKQAAEALSSR